MAQIAIIGLGSWGLCALERLIDAARRWPAADVEVHVVEPSRPGGGLYSRPGPDYLILNTPCGQHSLYPYPEQVQNTKLGKGFYDWAEESGYRWHGNECRVAPGGQAISPHDFLPRRLMGEYLEWFYGVLVAEAPDNARVIWHRARAVDIEAVGGERERVHLDEGPSLEVDHVILTPGHTEYGHTSQDQQGNAMRPYPVERYLTSFRPGEKVAIEGMGLVALDVVTALTVGLGGHYTTEPGGRLRYHPSGLEPELYLFSRTGYPYCAKSLGTADPVGGYQPAICTSNAIAALRGSVTGLPTRAIDVRNELLPLIVAEMELRYYTHSAQLDQGPEAAEHVHEDLVSAWRAGSFSGACAGYAQRYGTFRAADHIFIGEGKSFAGSADYESHVYASVQADVEEALVEGGASPVKAALETLRALRDIVRSAVDFKGQTLGSYLDFQTNLQGRLARPVTGPPVFRNQQLLALMDAGLVRLPFGPAPLVLPTSGGGLLVRSARFSHAFEMTFEHMVRAHIETPAVGRSTSPLLANLARRGRARAMALDGTPVGSIDLSSDFHPISDDGVERRLWVFGTITEGVRYFNLYIPSPKSRVRAFVDAERCAEEIVAASARALPMDERVTTSPLSLVLVGAHDSEDDVRGQAVVQLALVNNMPDGAFEETERQWRDLVSAWSGAEVDVRCFTLPGVERSPEVKASIANGYEDLGELWRLAPDALIITGAEPKRAELTDELYWPALEKLLWWGRSVVPSVLVSCLTAHAAVWTFDRLPRSLLPTKCTGVFRQVVARDHPLMRGVGTLSLPHSRFNEIPVTELEQVGYQVLAHSVGDGWTVAQGERGQCQLLLLQGHPEYSPLALLREYRRDVRRYLSGEQGSYPQIPGGYLGPDGVAALEQYQSEVFGRRDPALLEDLPFDLAASQVSAAWDGPAKVLMGNWLTSVHAAVAARGHVPPAVAPSGPGTKVAPSETAAVPSGPAGDTVALQ